jgi:hypothetical protein
MNQREHTCAFCGKAVENGPLDVGEGRLLYCSFGCEVRGLLKGLGWGVRWLVISLLWGLLLFTFIILIGRAIWGEPPARPVPFYGLIVVTGLLALIFSILRRRLKGE